MGVGSVGGELCSRSELIAPMIARENEQPFVDVGDVLRRL